MVERYLTGAIQKEDKDAKLAAVSARLLQIGCGIPIEPPTGRRRLSVIKEPFPLKLGTEKNGALAEGVALGTYDWAIPGWETVENLPDPLREKVTIVRHMRDVAPCQYRVGVSALAYGVETIEELEELIKRGDLTMPQTLEELRPGTQIATKHVNLMERIFRERNLDLRAVYVSTPETAPELRRIYWAADNFEKGTTWRAHNILPTSEVLLEPHAVLVKARRLSWGKGRIFNEEFLPRFDQALEHPERWHNPETIKVSENGQKQDDLIVSEQRLPWYRKLFPSKAGSAAVLSTLPVVLLMTFFTLPNLSAILNSWQSGTSKEKDLKS